MSDGSSRARAREIAPGVWQLAHQLAPGTPVHVTLVKGDYAVLIDTGVATTFPLIEQAFFESGLVAPQDVKLVLNTHGHHDHIGANRQVRAATGALIAAPAGAVPWIEDHQRHLREFLFHHPEIIADSAALRQEIGATMDGPVRVDLAIGEGFVVNLGGGRRLEAFALPGHVEAELAYFERDSGTLIMGDAMTRLDMPFFQGHLLPTRYRATVAKLRHLVRWLPVRQAAPGHYPVLTSEALLAQLERTEAHLDDLDALIVRLVREAPEPVSLETVWRGVCESAGKEPEFRSLAMVEAHLRELQVAGLITRTGPDQYAWLAPVNTVRDSLCP